jgi:DNA-binding transcriptional LysR family regulator
VYFHAIRPTFDGEAGGVAELLHHGVDLFGAQRARRGHLEPALSVGWNWLLRDDRDREALRLLASRASDGNSSWTLWRGKKQLHHRFEPVLVINEMVALKPAVVGGVGVALLPTHPCAAELARGDLVQVLPELRGRDGALWLQFAKRSQLSVVAAVVVDHLLASLPALVNRR